MMVINVGKTMPQTNDFRNCLYHLFMRVLCEMPVLAFIFSEMVMAISEVTDD